MPTFTVGTAAEICGVSANMIARHIEDSQIKTLGKGKTRSRKIPLDELVKFMKANDISTDGIKAYQHRVLIVEDYEPILNIIRHVLRNERFEVVVQKNGRMAIPLTASWRPHVVIFEPGLPSLDPWALCSSIAENPKLRQVRVVVMSSQPILKKHRGLTANGKAEFISKPFRVRPFKKMLGRMLPV